MTILLIAHCSLWVNGFRIGPPSINRKNGVHIDLININIK